MTRIIERTYQFSESDVREAILAMLKAKDMPYPDYVRDTDKVKWEGPGAVTLQWVEEIS